MGRSCLLAEVPGPALGFPRPRPYVVLLSFDFSLLLSCWGSREAAGGGQAAPQLHTTPGGCCQQAPSENGCQKATVTLPPHACSGESGCLQPSCSGWSPPSTSRPFKGHLAGMSSGRIYESCCSQMGKQQKKKGAKRLRPAQRRPRDGAATGTRRTPARAWPRRDSGSLPSVW